MSLEAALAKVGIASVDDPAFETNVPSFESDHLLWEMFRKEYNLDPKSLYC